MVLLKRIIRYDPHTDLAQVLRRMPFLTQPWSPLTTQGYGLGFAMIPGCPTPSHSAAQRRAELPSSSDPPTQISE